VILHPRIQAFAGSVGLVRGRRTAAKGTFVDLVTLLVVALLAAACGSGISEAPTEQPPSQEGGRDADKSDLPDADGGRDVPASPDVAPVDGRDDRLDSGGSASDGADVTSDGDANRNDVSNAPDVSLDGDASGGSDVSTDATGDATNDSAWDQSVDGGTPGDAPSDSATEAATDAGFDRDGAIPRPDVRDIANDPGADVPMDADLDTAIDNWDGCSVGCETEYYVDASAPLGGNGSQAAPFRTISAAIAAHLLVPDKPRTAHIAAGTYNQALGETFPLVLRGLSLEGAGSDKTFIVGAGALDHAGEGGPKNQQYTVTIVAGDRVWPTNVSRLAVRPAQPVPATGLHGIFCDRGNATGEVASPLGQTHLDEMTVGPGFDTGVMVVGSTNPAVTGCNMLMTRTIVTGGWTGVFAEGCNGASAALPVVLEMGSNDAASGNTVSWMQGQSGMGNGVFLNNCVARASFQYNSFVDSSTGLNIGGSVAPGAVTPFVVKHNTFLRMSNIGLYAWGSAIFIDEISDNRFMGATRTADSFLSAVGLRIEMPVVGKVRRNEFAGNDVGLRLDVDAEQTDVGRPGDPGGNVFYCNSGIDGWLGADVSIVYPMVRAPRGLRDDDSGADADDGGSNGLRFAGNAWDTVPPRVESVDLGTNGVEISLEWAPPLVFDLSDATLVTTACPTGRIR